MTLSKVIFYSVLTIVFLAACCGSLSAYGTTSSLTNIPSSQLAAQHRTENSLTDLSLAPDENTNTEAAARDSKIFPSAFLLLRQTKKYWVSTTGDNDNNGSQEAPFRTPDAAREAIRKNDTDYHGNIVVNIEAGTYRLKNKLALDARDSGKNGHTITYRGAGGGTTRLYGSEEINASKWAPCGHDPSIYCADISDKDPRVLESRQLYVNHQRAVRARTDDYPGGFMPYYHYDKTEITNSDPVGIMFMPVLDNDGATDPSWIDPSTWDNDTFQEIEAVALPQWRMLRVRLDQLIHSPDCTTGIRCLDLGAYYVSAAVYFDKLFGRAITIDPNQTGLITLQDPGWKNANLSYTTDPEKNYISQVWGFTRVAFFENGLQFLDEPGEWYLDKKNKMLYYKPRTDETMSTAVVELPKLETLLEVNGAENVHFENLTFAYATWTDPSSGTGYVTDQSGYLITGTDNEYNTVGHVQKVKGTPGNISLQYVKHIGFRGNIFEHLGAVALNFGTGTQNCVIADNLFEDIASAAINLGGVSESDYAPNDLQLTKNNTIRNNLIRYTAQDYYDAAAVFVGFSTHTRIDHNTIAHTNWSGIAMGWGWGLLDPGENLGLDGATAGMWGPHTEYTPNSFNEITNNRIYKTVGQVWDAGAVYTTGYQGSSADNALLIEGNVFSDRNPDRAGNTVYSDGMSRFINVRNNVMYNNPIGNVFFGGPVSKYDPFATQYELDPILNTYISYGADHGGCRTYGDINYDNNYWQYALFFDICPYTDDSNISYPTSLNYSDNKSIASHVSEAQIIADSAGVLYRPDSIPESRWIVPTSIIELK